MGFTHVWIAVGAAYMFFAKAHPVLGTLSVIVAVGSFWTYGIMHNCAFDAARQMGVSRPSFHFDNLTPAQHRIALSAVPNGLAFANLLLSVAGVLLLVVAIIVALVR